MGYDAEIKMHSDGSGNFPMNLVLLPCCGGEVHKGGNHLTTSLNAAPVKVGESQESLEFLFAFW